jgi:hypothetical protein
MDFPPPLEQTDPVLAEYFRRIVNDESEIRGLSLTSRGIVIRMRNGKILVKKTERNAPCFCGSGKKFKKCCIK